MKTWTHASYNKRYLVDDTGQTVAVFTRPEDAAAVLALRDEVLERTHPLAARVRSLRARLNLSQERLGALLNVSFATINRWESGTVKPQRAQLEALEKLIQETQGIQEPQTQTGHATGVLKPKVNDEQIRPNHKD